jgi:hypothetical protein
VWRTQAPSRTAFFSWLIALGKILFLISKRTLGKILMVDNLRKRNISSLWIDVACVREMRKLWITFFFTVMWLPLCGFTFLLDLVCLGLCLKELSIYLLVGGSLEGQGVLLFEDGAYLHFLVRLERKKF